MVGIVNEASARTSFLSPMKTQGKAGDDGLHGLVSADDHRRSRRKPSAELSRQKQYPETFWSLRNAPAPNVWVLVRWYLGTPTSKENGEAANR
jgi:hypothetical protein